MAGQFKRISNKGSYSRKALFAARMFTIATTACALGWSRNIRFIRCGYLYARCLSMRSQNGGTAFRVQYMPRPFVHSLVNTTPSLYCFNWRKASNCGRRILTPDNVKNDKDCEKPGRETNRARDKFYRGPHATSPALNACKASN